MATTNSTVIYERAAQILREKRPPIERQDYWKWVDTIAEITVEAFKTDTSFVPEDFVDQCGAASTDFMVKHMARQAHLNYHRIRNLTQFIP